MKSGRILDRTFILSGDGFDFEILKNKFHSPRATVEKIEGQYFLRMAGQFWTGDDDTDWVIAEDELSQMNGIAKMLQPNFRSVRIAGISVKDPMTGKMNSVMRGRGVCEIRIGVFDNPAQASGIGSIVLQDTTTEAGEILRLCDKHEHLARALLIYGALPHEWRELSMVVDAIEDHHGSEKELEKKDYYSPKLRKFSGTANSWKAIKLAARHGSTIQKRGGVEEPRITLREAKEVIRKLLEDTLNSLKPQA